MKHLILKLVLPLTLFSFVFVTKWAYVLPEDAPDDMLFGFPLPYRCSGWHTSLSEQYFLMEMAFDLLVYFIIWLAIIYLVNRLIAVRPNRAIVAALWLVTVLSLAFPVLRASNPDNVFKTKRDFKYEEVDTGVHFMWDSETNPDYEKYFPEEKR
ncbi:hypothetical protein OGH69_17920 [Flavobacterium sp. MFBS3-15]|uniref:hypothetical protein n=1 Tax=Flavobacterium sp. MFBS3-15 TaxID=2989816 RepID=UPI002235FED6|nr:hypothetical protein [Flavobacterium sp. MFBS3-15]MCW4470851.1 hypothetical protein [Flavobacterium sp. MFBS3-15]